jgi:stringent starvation protein B
MTTPAAMSSNRPYLLRALYEWINDNGLTPYILVDATNPAVRVPPGAAKDGKVVLNIAARAVTQFEITNERIHFLARFGGVSQQVDVPLPAVLAIYAQENGQGMMFPADSQTPPPAPEPAKRSSHLKIVK